MSKIIEDLNWRYATKKFDPNKKISSEQFEIIKESLRLVPSSYGLQPLKFIIVESPEIRQKLIPASFGQTQVNDASHLIVICVSNKLENEDVDAYVTNTSETRDISTDKMEGYANFIKKTIAGISTEEMLVWNSKQAYIALGQLLHTCANMRIDATPMEGFDPIEYSKLLGIDSQIYTPVLLCPIGYRHEEDATQHLAKVRKSNADIFEVK